MQKSGRNDPCPCGSGLKYKNCCMGKPPKPKFSAKVIKSGKDEMLEMIGKIHTPDESAFKMTDKDFRVSK